MHDPRGGREGGREEGKGEGEGGGREKFLQLAPDYVASTTSLDALTAIYWAEQIKVSHGVTALASLLI